MYNLTFDVPVNDVPAAVRFYCLALRGTLSDGPDESGACRVSLKSSVLRVVNEAGFVPNTSDEIYYTKGRTPRMELRVDDVAARVGEALSAGATLRSRTPGSDEDGPMAYAHVIDPFGHLWAFADLLPDDVDDEDDDPDL